MKTMISILLDRSGSMGGREGDVVQGVNNFLIEQRKLPDPACVAITRFDTEGTERFRGMTDLAFIHHIAIHEYQPRGGTPLNDAICNELELLEQDWRRERPDRAIVVIVTDGHENSSRRFTKAQVKRMVQARQESGKWSFIYLGANVDAFDEAQGLGIWASNAAGYTSTAAGTASAYHVMSNSVSNMRVTGQSTAGLGGNISEQGTIGTFKAPAADPAALPVEPWTVPDGTPSGETWKEPA